MKRSYLREGAVQLTALESLVTSSRYFFLFSDLLLIAKQKATNSYKLKEKISLNRLWIASNDCPNSFLIGWPINNFIAHFSTEEEKIEWEELLKQRIAKVRAKITPKFTTVPVSVRVDGRIQVMKKRIGIMQTSTDILCELNDELAISSENQLELLFETGNGEGLRLLHGPESVFSILMDHVKSSGYRLTEVQLEKIDALPLIQCRLVLANAGSFRCGTNSIVTQFRRVLSRSESRRFFGRPLEGSLPPQPVLTMIDHLTMHGIEVEGLFRKSPKQSTVRLLKAQLDRGSVPDFYQFNPHVTAALVKEYLRDIPGKLLLSGNFELWAAAMDESVDRFRAVQRLLQMLPSAHYALLVRFIRLLRAIANSPHSKMCAQSLAVCVAPSLLENPRLDATTSWLPELTEYLISNAPFLLEPFHDVQPAISSSISNDSGLSDVDGFNDAPISSPDSGILGSRTSTSSTGMNGNQHSAPLICSNWKHQCSVRNNTSSGYYVSNISTDEEEEDEIDEMGTEVEREEDDDKTPVLSRENSNLQTKPTIPSVILKRKSNEKFESDSSRNTLMVSPTNYRRSTLPEALDANDHRRITDWKTSRMHDNSPPCRRRLLEGSPASIRKAMTLETDSPASLRKSMVMENGSPVLFRKGSVISTTPSMRSDSTLRSSPEFETSASMPLPPDSPVIPRKCPQGNASRKNVTRNTFPIIDNTLLFFSPRRKECDTPGYTQQMAPISRLNSAPNTAPIPRAELFRRHQRGSIQPEKLHSFEPFSATRSHSVSEEAFRLNVHPDSNRTTVHSITETAYGKLFQMPVISSPILRAKHLVRRESDRKCKNSTENCNQSLTQQPTTSVIIHPTNGTRSRPHRPLTSTSSEVVAVQPQIPAGTTTSMSNKNNKSTTVIQSDQSTTNSRLIVQKANSVTQTQDVLSSVAARMKVDSEKVIESQKRPLGTDEIGQDCVIVVGQSRTPMRERHSFCGASGRTRKKNRTILMEPLEVNWSVDELRTKFQNDSERVPRLDTTYATCASK